MIKRSENVCKNAATLKVAMETLSLVIGIAITLALRFHSEVHC
jgi:hypothetical protein